MPETNDGGAGRAVLRAAASAAPRGPGVYLFLDDHGTVLYVGKAGDLPRRLRQHAAAGDPTSHLHRRYDLVRRVGWETTAGEEAAAWREADLIFALQPPFNADPGLRNADPAGGQAPVPYLVVTDDLRLGLETVVVPGARAYGCFPHLGKGVSSRLGVACSDGYTALLRLLWAASGRDGHMPASITRSAPPAFTVTAGPGVRDSLHRFLSGTSSRLPGELLAAAAGRPAFLQPALRRDREAALGFFAAGPELVRARRLRHGVRGRTLDPGTYRRLVADEIRPVIEGAAALT